ncbi:hypothetical protein ACWV26_11485 [Rummeliibacillus sp. JY-2-4R]
MKKLLNLFLLLIMIISLIGCNNEAVKSEKDIEELVKNYKSAQYNIKDPANPPTELEIAGNLKVYLSTDVYEKQMANRVFQIAPDVAAKTRSSIELENIKLEKKKENNDGSIDYTYTLRLKFQNEKSTDVVEKSGRLTTKDQKIIYDWEERDTKIGNEFF